MTLRFENNRPVGLDWNAIRPVADISTPARRPVEPKPPTRPTGARKRTVNPTRGPARLVCDAGHCQEEHWRPNKNGDGGYCNACKNERARKYRESGKQREYRARKHLEQQRVPRSPTAPGMSDYRCNHCGKITTRESEKRWITSYCDATGRTTRLWKVTR